MYKEIKETLQAEFEAIKFRHELQAWHEKAVAVYTEQKAELKAVNPIERERVKDELNQLKIWYEGLYATTLDKLYDPARWVEITIGGPKTFALAVGNGALIQVDKHVPVFVPSTIIFEVEGQYYLASD